MQDTHHKESKWSANKLNKLNQLLDEGLTRTECAERFHCHTTTISNQVLKLVQMGLQVRNTRPSAPRWTADRQSELIDLIKNNPDWSRLEIADRLGVTKNSVAGQVHRLQKRGLLERDRQAEFRHRNSHKAKQDRLAREAEREQTGNIRPLKPHRKSRAKPETKLRPKMPSEYNPSTLPSSKRSHKRATLQANVSAGGDRLPRTTQEMAIIRRRKSNYHEKIRESGIADKVVELRANQCRYLFGDTTDPNCHYCEEDRLGDRRMYCQEHTDLCRTPTRIRSGTQPHYR